MEISHAYWSLNKVTTFLAYTVINLNFPKMSRLKQYLKTLLIIKILRFFQMRENANVTQLKQFAVLFTKKLFTCPLMNLFFAVHCIIIIIFIKQCCYFSIFPIQQLPFNSYFFYIVFTFLNRAKVNIIY